MRHTSVTYTWVKLFKRPEVSSEPPTHFLNNGKALPTSVLTSFSFYKGTGKLKGIGFLEIFKDPIY